MTLETYKYKESMVNCGDCSVRTTRPNAAMVLLKTAGDIHVTECETIGNLAVHMLHYTTHSEES